MGIPLIVIMDDSALRALQTKDQLVKQMQRYAKKLLTFDYEIQYCPGNDNFTPALLL